MKTLYLLRHAKSSWADAEISDFERPLNERGLKTAPFVGNLMKERGLIPEVIICSPAKRARETANLVCHAAGFVAEIKFENRIYEASVGTLLSAVAELDEIFESVLLIGHNPGAEGFVYYLTEQLVPMPTAALAVIELNVENWDEIGGGGRLVRVIRPKDEMQ